MFARIPDNSGDSTGSEHQGPDVTSHADTVSDRMAAVRLDDEGGLDDEGWLMIG